MKRDNKKALYESIMTSVAAEVKKALDESALDESEISRNAKRKYLANKHIKYIAIMYDTTSKYEEFRFHTNEYHSAEEIFSAYRYAKDLDENKVYNLKKYESYHIVIDDPTSYADVFIIRV